MISMWTIYFILFGPIIGGVLGFIIQIIAWCIDSSDNKPKSYSHSYSSGSNYSCGSSYSFHESDYNEIERNRILSSMEMEMRNHNARMEQMMMEQHRNMIENESRRISESINRPLSEQFDTRLTNIFRNTWEGIL